MSARVDKVRGELARYAHPLFVFDARPAGEDVEIMIRFKPMGVAVHDYSFRMLPREIDHAQFPYLFQKQLYDCLHDYIIEMFTDNPQRRD